MASLGKRIGLHVDNVALHLRRAGHEIVTGAEPDTCAAKVDFTGERPVLERRGAKRREGPGVHITLDDPAHPHKPTGQRRHQASRGPVIDHPPTVRSRQNACHCQSGIDLANAATCHPHRGRQRDIGNFHLKRDDQVNHASSHRFV